MKVPVITLVVAAWMLAGCEAAVPANMASLGGLAGLTPDVQALVLFSANPPERGHF